MTTRNALMPVLTWACVTTALPFSHLACDSNPSEPAIIEILPIEGLQGFEAELDSLRVVLRIPGIAAAIAKDGAIVWSKGFGFADAEAERPATPSTPYHLASLTKTFAATIVMQLVEQGLVSLEDPVSQYGVDLEADGVIRVRHLLTHTSEGVPGSFYRYSGDRFGELDRVVQGAANRSFGEFLVERILQPIQLRETAPNPMHPDFDRTGLNRDQFMAEMAAGYDLRDGQVVPEGHSTYFGTAAGLVASAEDVARYSIAVDQGRFLEPETWDSVFTPAVSNDGATLPHGLGWFIYEYEGAILQWHYGYWNSNSSLIVRAPQKGLTFVVVANTNMLSRAYNLGVDANVLRSAVALLFVESFVLGDEPFPQ
jgi:CubicO group peptidase (beta-lactamase class C family)